MKVPTCDEEKTTKATLAVVNMLKTLKTYRIKRHRQTDRLFYHI